MFGEILKKFYKKDIALTYDTLSDAKKEIQLSSMSKIIESKKMKESSAKSTIESIELIGQIQKSNGEKGCHRYIISNNKSAINIFEMYTMIRLVLGNESKVDVVPLFESVSDLENSSEVMDEVYSNKVYRDHLKNRGDVQTIMLGFSDGTKDGGYLTANWSILKAKESLTRVSRKFGIKVLFFDGRGGPPARGGGNTHQFYLSLIHI